MKLVGTWTGAIVLLIPICRVSPIPQCSYIQIEKFFGWIDDNDDSKQNCLFNECLDFILIILLLY